MKKSESMNCTSCGYPFCSRYAFRFCPACGAATDSDPRIATLFHIPVWLKHNRLAQLGALGLASVVVIGTGAMAVRSGSSSPEKAIEQYYDLLLLGGSYGELKDSVPTKLRNEIMSDYHLKSDYVKEQWKDIVENDEYIFFDKEVAEVEIHVLKEKKNSETITFDDFCEHMSQYDTQKGGFDANDITEVRYVEFRVTLMDEDGKYLDKYTTKKSVFKYKGRWYLTDAVETFEEICEEC